MKILLENLRTTPCATKIALEVMTRSSVVAATDIGMSSLQKVQNMTHHHLLINTYRRAGQVRG